MGIRKDCHLEFQFPEKIKKNNLTLEHILNISADVPNQTDWALSPQALDMVEYIPEGGSWKDIPYEHLAPRFKKIRDDMKKISLSKFLSSIFPQRDLWHNDSLSPARKLRNTAPSS